jgi:hypothetical protein
MRSLGRSDIRIRAHSRIRLKENSGRSFDSEPRSMAWLYLIGVVMPFARARVVLLPILPLPHAIRPPLAMIVSEWLGERAGRTVRLRVGEGEAVARSTEQAEIFLWRAHQLREAPSMSDEEDQS